MRLLTYSIPLLTLLAASPAAYADDPAPRHTRMTWEERFTQANASHDGHLTLEEAKSGYKAIARHFQEIDTEGKGYITVNDVRAWHALQKAARQKAVMEDPLRPRPAYHLMQGEQRTMNDTAVVMAP